MDIWHFGGRWLSGLFDFADIPQTEGFVHFITCTYGILCLWILGSSLYTLFAKKHFWNSSPLFQALKTQNCAHEKSIMIGGIVNMEHCRWPDSSPSQSHMLRCLFDLLWYTKNELNLGIWHVALKLKLASHAKPLHFVTGTSEFVGNCQWIYRKYSNYRHRHSWKSA